MKTLVRENTWLKRDIMSAGWGNGYVLIPPTSPLYGKHYHDIPVSVHCGLTFSEIVDDELIALWKLDKEDKGMWCVGFDTAHYNDTLENWPKEAVIKETERLKSNLIELESEIYNTKKNELD